MVEVKNIIPDEKYLTSGAIEKKEIQPDISAAHSRECHELNEALNCKMTVEKKSTAEEAEAYGQIIEEKPRKRKYSKF